MASILVVEQNKETTQWVTQVLDKLKHNTSHFENISNDELLELIAKESVELVILGISNSEQNFFNILDTLKGHPEHEAIPVLIMEKNENPDLLARYLDKGVYGFLHRSSNDIYIQSRVRSALKTFEFIKKYRDLNQKLKIKNLQMDEFVGIVSHDLRIPIGNLNSICEMLEEDPEMISDIMPQMKDTVNNASSLINDLLDLTAMETGKIVLDYQLYSVKELFRHAILETKYLADKKEISLESESADTHLVRVDIRRILQVLNNLVTNAIKFTTSGGKIILRSALEDNNIRLSVIDNGIGIPETKLDKLFDKHSRISSQGTNGEQGTGFGLPLAHSYVTAHKSKLEVSSASEQGSHFSFCLPLKEKEEN